MKSTVVVYLNDGQIHQVERHSGQSVDSPTLNREQLILRLPPGFNGTVTINFNGTCAHERSESGGCCRRVTARDETDEVKEK